MPLINYISNRQECLDNKIGGRGNAPERTWGAVSASYNATQRTTGSLTILNDGNIISTLTTSGSLFNARISASSNEVGVRLSGSVTETTLTGSFTMSLAITSSDYSYNTIVYSFGELNANFIPISGSTYIISGSLSYDNDGTFTTCSYYFVKSGITSPQATTASYTPCGTTSSVDMYFSSSLVTASLGCVRDGTVSWNPEGIPTQFAQIFQSPYGCDFLYPTASSGGNRRVRFETPTAPFPEQNWYMASWVPEGTNTYEFQILKPGETLTVCTADINSAFFAGGENGTYGKDYIVDLGVC